MASGDHMAVRTDPAISLRLLPDEFLDAERRAFADIERAGTLVEFRAQPSQLLHVREKLSADLLLIVFRKCSHFRKRLLKCLYHVGIIAHVLCRTADG